MYDITQVTECLNGLIGFRTTKDIEDNDLTPELLESGSGMYWEDAHPLITVENLCYIKPEEQSFNTWAKEKVDASVKKLFSSLVEQKLNKKSIKSLLASAQMYLGVANRHNKEVKQGRFVGFMIEPKRHNGMVLDFKKIGTQFSETNTELTLYVYNTSQIEPVTTIKLNTGTANSFAWHESQLSIAYESQTYDKGSIWYIGYYEDDLQGQAINKDNISFKKGPCSYCSPSVYENFLAWSQYINITPIEVLPSDIEDDRSLFDIEKVGYVYENKTFGLNLSMVIRCDLTNLICQQRNIFTKALSQQFVVDILKEMANSTRLNRVEQMADQKAMFQLKTSANNTKGEEDRLQESISAIDFDFSDLGSACLACSQKNGVRYGSF